MSGLAGADIRCRFAFETRSWQENKVCVDEYICDSRADDHMDRMTERLISKRLRRPNDEKTNLDSAVDLIERVLGGSSCSTYGRAD